MCVPCYHVYLLFWSTTLPNTKKCLLLPEFIREDNFKNIIAIDFLIFGAHLAEKQRNEGKIFKKNLNSLDELRKVKWLNK